MFSAVVQNNKMNSVIVCRVFLCCLLMKTASTASTSSTATTTTGTTTTTARATTTTTAGGTTTTAAGTTTTTARTTTTADGTTTTTAAPGSQVTSWTTPSIATKDGSGTIADALAEDGTNTFPQLAATGAVNYVIYSQTPPGAFTINAMDGQLSLNGTLDYETYTQHVMVVKADDGSGSTGTATITINIEDVNDNPPAFPAAGYSTCVADPTAAATTLLTVTTTDADTTTTANAISAMTITVGNTNTDFAINSDGVLTTANALNKTLTAGYALEVKAADSDSGTKLTGTTTIFITVSDSCGCNGAGTVAASLVVTLLLGLVTSLVS